MFIELIATFVAGFAGAGMMMLINRITGNRLPRWLIPVAAGAAMIATTISSEYGWFGRERDNLPAEFVIVDTVESRVLYRPWTYVKPFVERFVALDTATIQTNQARPEQRIANLYFYGRWSPVNRIGVLADCAAYRRAALVDGISFADDGTVEGVEWVTVERTDPIVSAICGAN